MKRLLIDVDGVVLIRNRPHPPSAYRPAKPVSPRARVSPGLVNREACRLLDELYRSGTDIVWNSWWLTTPDHLTALARDAGLAFIRMPSPAELPVTPDLEQNMDWKIGAWQASLATGVECVIADDQLTPSMILTLGPLATRAGWIRPRTDEGLSLSDLALLLAWSTGSALAPRRF